MAFAAAGLYARVRHLLPELIKFGVVGGIGSVIDLGGAALLHRHHVGPLESKAISTAAATVVTYLGSRFWTFKHRENQALGREAVLFIALNVVGLLIAEAVIALVTYGMGLRNGIEYNAASFIGTGLATIFRYLAYRTWVFTAPAGQAALGSATGTELAPFPDYPPWELDPAYLAAAHAEAHAEAAAHAPVPAYSSPWQPAAEQGSWESASQHQPWMERHVTLPNERVTAPTRAKPDSAHPAAAGPDLGPADPFDGPRSQGRHRRP